MLMNMGHVPRGFGRSTGETDPEDRRLLDALTAALAAGDREATDRAFEAIYRRHARTVGLVCARYLTDDEAILSATDNVFIALFRRAPHLELTGSLRAYLAASARNAAMDLLREQARRESHLAASFAPADGETASGSASGPAADSVVDPLDRLPDPDADVGASLRYRELIRDLHTVLDSRHEHAVDILLSHAVYGETFGEIAARLGMKENTARTVYHRALKAFRQKKGENWL